MMSLCVVCNAAKPWRQLVLAPNGVIDECIHANPGKRAVLLRYKRRSFPLPLSLGSPCEGFARCSFTALELNKSEARVRIDYLDHTVFARNEETSPFGIKRQTRRLATGHDGIVAVFFACVVVQNMNDIRRRIGNVDMPKCATGDLPTAGSQASRPNDLSGLGVDTYQRATRAHRFDGFRIIVVTQRRRSGRGQLFIRSSLHVCKCEPDDASIPCCIALRRRNLFITMHDGNKQYVLCFLQRNASKLVASICVEHCDAVIARNEKVSAFAIDSYPTRARPWEFIFTQRLVGLRARVVSSQPCKHCSVDPQCFAICNATHR